MPDPNPTDPMLTQLIKEWPEVLFFGALFVIILFV